MPATVQPPCVHERRAVVHDDAAESNNGASHERAQHQQARGVLGSTAVTLRFMNKRCAEVLLVEVSGALDIAHPDGDMVERDPVKGGCCSASRICGSRDDR